MYRLRQDTTPFPLRLYILYVVLTGSCSQDGFTNDNHTMKRDDLIFSIIENEHQRQLKGMELIASENFVSDEVMQAMGSILENAITAVVKW